MPRMNILNKSEQEKFNTPPIFTSFERKQFFTLPKPLKEIAETLRTPSTRIGFLLACDYFKASKRFFKPNDYHKNDITFVINTLNLRSEYFIVDHYLRGIRQYHQKVILEFYGYKKFDHQSIRLIKVEIASMMQSQLRPKLIFWRCIDILIYNRIQIPTYFMISELILTALNQRKKELLAVIRQELSKETKTLLDSLFARKEEGQYARYKLTLLKKLSQSTKPTQIKERTDTTADSLKPYFPELHFVPLPEILSTVNGYTAFLQEFQHWQHTYTKSCVDDKILYAGIIGLGCAIGTPKMSRISKFINASSLQYAVNWYFSLENIRAANDCIVRVMNKMDLPNIYRKNYDMLHTASDGQKFEVRVDSLNANYSFKYFGKGQGVTTNTFIDERNLLWHSLVFSAAERESAYVIDGLMHNDVIKSDIHSTDTHGYSETIFAVTYLLGFSYAPRIKNLKKQTRYIFKSSKHKRQSHWAVQPEKYINHSIIEEYWEDILRLIVTIKLKETSASDIFRRLNSYSRQHSLYYALKSFGQIIKSDFLLRYINDLELRKAIEKQLSKIELANRFTRAIAVGSPREFTQGDKEEQEIAESCNRLIKNSIICWNYLYLSQKLEKITDLEQREKLLAAIASHSIISWAHTNLLGEYDFSDEKLKDSVGITLKKK